MKQRLENCKYCGNKLADGTTRKKFCSDKCRVYWNRENELLPIPTQSYVDENLNEIPKEKQPSLGEPVTINLRRYDYSKMPKKLNHFQQLIWKEKARKEQDEKLKTK